MSVRATLVGLVLVVAFAAAPAAAQESDSTSTTTTIVLSSPSTSILVEEPPATTVDLSAPGSTIPTVVAGAQETNPAQTAPALAQTGTSLHLLYLGLALMVCGAFCLAFVGDEVRSVR